MHQSIDWFLKQSFRWPFMAKCWIMTQYQWLIVNSLMSLQFFIVFVPQPIYCKNGYLSYWKTTHIFSSIFFAAKLTSLFSKLSVSPLPVSGANSGDNNNRRNSICNGYAGARPRSSSFRFRRPSGSGLDEDAAGVQLRRRLENEAVCQKFHFFALFLPWTKVCRPYRDFSSFTI